jgi:hypothetical protein
LDGPLATNWQVFPEWTSRFPQWVELRVEALNHALRGIPRTGAHARVLETTTAPS